MNVDAVTLQCIHHCLACELLHYASVSFFYSIIILWRFSDSDAVNANAFFLRLQISLQTRGPAGEFTALHRRQEWKTLHGERDDGTGGGQNLQVPLQGPEMEERPSSPPSLSGGGGGAWVCVCVCVWDWASLA